MNVAFKNFLEGCIMTTEAVNKLLDQDKAEEKSNSPPEVLTAAKISELKWMGTKQLATIYGYGKRKVTIEDSPDAYSELKWLTTSQLEAIFGKEDDDG